MTPAGGLLFRGSLLVVLSPVPTPGVFGLTRVARSRGSMATPLFNLICSTCGVATSFLGFSPRSSAMHLGGVAGGLEGGGASTWSNRFAAIGWARMGPSPLCCACGRTTISLPTALGYSSSFAKARQAHSITEGGGASTRGARTLRSSPTAPISKQQLSLTNSVTERGSIQAAAFLNQS